MTFGDREEYVFEAIVEDDAFAEHEIGEGTSMSMLWNDWYYYNLSLWEYLEEDKQYIRLSTTDENVYNSLCGWINAGWSLDNCYIFSLDEPLKGNISIASAQYAEGSNTSAVLEAAHAEGFGSYAIGAHSHAEGSDTEAIGSGSHAEGFETHAIGDGSHAEGECTNAEGYLSHAEGLNTIAEGEAAHAEGNGTIALGDYSHAGGSSSLASHYAQFVHGKYVKLSSQTNDGAAAFGRFNDENSSALFAIGNGSAEPYYEDAGRYQERTITYVNGWVYCDGYPMYVYEEQSDDYFQVGEQGFEDGYYQEDYDTFYIQLPETRKNAFEVHEDGHAEVQTTNIDNDKSVVTMETLKKFLVVSTAQPNAADYPEGALWIKPLN